MGMTFHSLLFGNIPPGNLAGEAPPCLSDLNLDLVIDAITEPQEMRHLKPYFYTTLQNIGNVLYRQEIVRELSDQRVMLIIKGFLDEMATVHRCLALMDKLDFSYHKKGWFLESALLYCKALSNLCNRLNRISLESMGLNSFRAYVADILGSSQFRSLFEEAEEVKNALSQIRYCVILQSGKFKVKMYEGEEDYSLEVEKTFEKFRQNDVAEEEISLPSLSGTSHIEAKILEFVARLYPEPFSALEGFCERHSGFLDETILHFEKEVLFYTAYLQLISPLKEKGLPFCLPKVNSTSKEEEVVGGFDIALACREGTEGIVLNDYSLRDGERMVVVTGPNQGGKTTFARMFGQIHYLASLGLPVPGIKARLSLPDRIFTHFEKEETIHDLRGKLEDDLIRIHEMLSEASSASLFVVNEIFSSTTFQDALFLSRKIMEEILEMDAMGVWVTFIDELSSMSEKVVSMVATVSPHDPAIRTFKIVKAPARGLAHALSLAKKHRLTYEDILERIG